MRSSGPRGDVSMFPDALSARGRLTRRWADVGSHSGDGWRAVLSAPASPPWSRRSGFCGASHIRPSFWLRQPTGWHSQALRAASPRYRHVHHGRASRPLRLAVEPPRVSCCQFRASILQRSIRRDFLRLRKWGQVHAAVANRFLPRHAAKLCVQADRGEVLPCFLTRVRAAAA
jgi:hypothetical protein